MILKKSDNESTVIRFSKLVVTSMFISIWTFTIAMIVTFFIKDDVPDMLIEKFFAFWGIEGGALASITIIKNVFANKKDKNKNANETESVPQNPQDAENQGTTPISRGD